MALKPLIAGNWKMHGLQASVQELRALVSGLGADDLAAADVLLCPPATLIAGFAGDAGPVRLGGQDCHSAESGAHTGDIAAEMLADAGAEFVILGHSERRTDHGETSASVREKVSAAWRAGLTPIACVGEQKETREAGQAVAFVLEQLSESLPDNCTGANMVVAYEPVWAIGTGLVATPSDVAEMHDAIRDALESRFGADGGAIRILYGGSVKPGNAAEILATSNVGGALVGGASLKAADFIGIVRAVPAT